MIIIAERYFSQFVVILCQLLSPTNCYTQKLDIRLAAKRMDFFPDFDVAEYNNLSCNQIKFNKTDKQGYFALFVCTDRIIILSHSSYIDQCSNINLSKQRRTSNIFCFSRRNGCLVKLASALLDYVS